MLIDFQRSYNKVLPIMFEALKTIDIKDTNQTVGARILSYGDIDFVHQPGYNKCQAFATYLLINLQVILI